MVRTRFAPSPTGYLHIGGVRTALFCWLFAKKHGGQFILRIDDTDSKRNVEEALGPILHGFKWLGIDWDEGPEVGGPHEPYYQSQRLELYQSAVQKLLDAGKAYYDYATPDELAAEREEAQKNKTPFIYSRKWMADTDEKKAAFEAEGRQAVVRLKMPREGKLVINDIVRGDVEFEWAREQDHVVQRADGTCLYHLATVVDDHDLEITHVIRAEEHLSNTPRQVFILQSLGYDVPEYAHLPFVAEPGSKNKLSKRKLDKYLKNRDFAQVNDHGMKIAESVGMEVSADTFNPVIVDFYEHVGYLPEAILNYLLLIGWSIDDKTEFISIEDAIQTFSLDRVVKASASFDPKKLWAFQDHYMRECPMERKVEMMIPYLLHAGLISDPDDPAIREKLAKAVEAAGDRIKVAGDVIQYTKFFFEADDEFEYVEKDFQKRLVKKEEAGPLLKKFRAELEKLDDFSNEALEICLKSFIEAEGIKIGDVIHAIRISTTGVGVGPGLYDCLSILGKDAVLCRMDRTLAKLNL